MVKVNQTQWLPGGGKPAAMAKKPVILTPSAWVQADPEGKLVEPKKAVQLKPSAWEPISGLQDPFIIRQFEGVNGLDSFSIQDGQATDSTNFTSSKYPALAVRNGNTSWLWDGMKNQNIDGVAFFVNGDYYELTAVAGGKWYVIRNTQLVTIASGFTPGNKASFAMFKGNYGSPNLIMSSKDGNLIRYDGSGPIGIPQSPLKANHVCTHDNRIYCAVDSTVYFSALNKGDDWSTVNDSGQIVVESNDGQKITGLVAGSQRLTIFKQNSLYELFGTSPSNFTMKKVAENAGTPTGRSAQVIDGTIYFLGMDSVYRYSGGSQPTSDFAVPIKHIIAKMNKDWAKNAVSWTVGRKYYLAIPMGTFSSTSTVLEYDIDFDIWNVWQFQGDTFPNYPTASGASLNGITYVGMSTGHFYLMDGQQGWDDTYSIPFEWVSKPFTFQSMAAKVRWFRMWIVADVPTGASLDIYLSGDKDGDNWTKVKSYAPSANMVAEEIVIPTNLFIDSRYIRVRLAGFGQVVIHELSRQERSFPMGLS